MTSRHLQTWMRRSKKFLVWVLIRTLSSIPQREGWREQEGMVLLLLLLLLR